MIFQKAYGPLRVNSNSELLNVLNIYSPNLSSSSYLISYDVESLFTNVPLSEVIDITTNYLYNVNNCKKPPINKDVFKKLLEYATSGIFSYNGNYFCQIDGVTMGSPLGPTLANIFLAHYETDWQSFDFSPKFYYRYVDDIICIFDNSMNCNSFFDFINNQHSNLKFTCEHGNKEIPFLDIEIKLDLDCIHTSIYRKDTFTGLLLNYNAICPLQWKKGLIIGMLNRAFNVCSNWHLLHIEFEKITKMLIENNYPRYFVLNIIKHFLYTKLDSKIDICDSTNVERKTYYFKIPYIGQTSDNFKKKLTILFKKFDIKTQIVFNST